MKKLRVLVVDDNEDSAQLLKLMLGIAGHESRVADDAQSALEVVRTFSPDAAILDIGLPSMNGYDLARRLRETPGLEHVCLIATTGFSGEDDRRQARSAGFAHFLVKPIDADEIERILAALPR